MWHQLTVLIAAAPLLLRAEIAALRPIYTPETVVAVPEITGVWDDKLALRIEPDDGNGYDVFADAKPLFNVHFVRLDHELIADIAIPTRLLDLSLPFHGFARVRVQGDRMVVDWLGSGTFEERIRTAAYPKHEMIDLNGDFIILTGSAAELQEFVKTSFADPDAFGNSDTLMRAGIEVRASDLNRQAWAALVGEQLTNSTKALAQAEEAVTLVNNEAEYWDTLALARLRVDRVQDALGAVIRAESLRSAPDPADLAIHGMVFQELGQKTEAQAVLARLRILFADHSHCESSSLLRLYRQAAESIDPKKK
jgi:hypothetical protein